MVQALEKAREYGLYIGGKWRNAEGWVSAADVDAAVRAAAEAFKSWRLQRAQIDTQGA